MRLELEHTAAHYPLQESDEPSSLQSPDQSSSDIIKRGIASARDGNRTQARILLKHGVELDPSSEIAWMWLASISEYPEELLVFLDQVLLINPANRRAVEWKSATEILLAKTFVQRGIDAANSARNDNAIQYFNEALKYDEQNQIAWSWLESMNASAKSASNDEAQSQNDFSVPEASALEFVEESPSRTPAVERPKTYTPPHSESVVLHPLPIFENANDDGPTQELVFPDSLLESNPFESFAEELPRPVENQSWENVGYSEPEVLSFAETMTAEDDVILSDEVLTEVPHQGTSVQDCDIQEVLAAVSMEDYDTPTYDTQYETAVQQPQQWFAPTIEKGSNFAINNDGGFCPFCNSEVGTPAIVCHACDAMLTMSDIDALLTHRPTDPSKLQPAVKILEDLREAGNLNAESLVNLAIGYLNLGEMEAALSGLHEASVASPNNVLITNHLNTLAIRIEEIRDRQERTPDVPVGKVILVVDDSPTIRKLISGKLEKAGHEVFCAEDGIEAVEMLKTLQPDLVLLDITMPKLDGYQVCKSIRSNEKTKNIPVVMISGKDGFFDKMRGMMAGTTDYITKPFGPEALMKALGKYLHGTEDEVEISE